MDDVFYICRWYDCMEGQLTVATDPLYVMGITMLLIVYFIIPQHCFCNRCCRKEVIQCLKNL